MSQNDTNRDTTPFVMFYNGLEFLGRMVDSGCKISQSFMAAANEASHSAADSVIQSVEITEEIVAASTPEPVRAPASMPMIPDTGDLAASAKAVELAMNEAARRQLDFAVAKDTGEELESAREAVARAKSAISAVKSNKPN